MTLETIMTREVVTIGMDERLESIRGLLLEHGFHHLVVVHEKRVVGIVSDRDVLKHLSPFVGQLAEQQRDVACLSKRAHQIMTRKVASATVDTPIAEGAATMLSMAISCLPVMDRQGRLSGIVTDRDVMRWLAQEAVCRPRAAA
ncbi:MAG: CBS domain-containing protein [Phycisphaeraceae bacterium]|nr:CBS domain-containing protein [Phycisphaeraceae bacterium]